MFGRQGSDSTIAGESLEAQCLCEVGVTRRISTRSCSGLGKANCQDVEGVGNFLGGFEHISRVVLLKHYYENARNQDKKNQKLCFFFWWDGQRDADIIYRFRCRLVFRFRSSSLEFPSDAKLEGMNSKYTWDIFKHTRKCPLKKKHLWHRENIYQQPGNFAGSTGYTLDRCKCCGGTLDQDILVCWDIYFNVNVKVCFRFEGLNNLHTTTMHQNKSLLGCHGPEKVQPWIFRCELLVSREVAAEGNRMRTDCICLPVNSIALSMYVHCLCCDYVFIPKLNLRSTLWRSMSLLGEKSWKDTFMQRVPAGQLYR